MKESNSLSHLPIEKQKEINFILEIIKLEANPLKVILFGSHATGKWVDSTVLHDGITLTYESDYDILVVTRDGNIKHHDIISRIENKCNEELRGITSILVHSLEYINKGLAIGQYFFLRILKEGIVLYDTGEDDFLTPVKLTNKQFKERSEGYFEVWFPMGVDFLIDAKNAFNRNSFRKSLFELHQATENFYATVMLVFSGYKPTVHNLKKLRKYAKHLSPDLYNLFLTPQSDEVEYRLFELLRKGYIEARYERNFEVSKEECEILIKRVEQMMIMVNKLCHEKINSIE